MSSEMPGRASQGQGVRQFLRQSLLSGTAIVVPVLITAVVLLFATDVLSSLLSPVAIPIRQALGTGGSQTPWLPELLALAVIGVAVLLVGAYSESDFGRRRIDAGVDATMSRIPGISSIYGPLDRMSEMLLEADTDNFQEVVLVEYPEAGSYSVAFKTAEPPGRIRKAVDSAEMITVFMPMGPNPFMGGFIMHVDADQVHDVDLSVEEGITSIVSFGVAVQSDEGRRDDAEDLSQYAAERRGGGTR